MSRLGDFGEVRVLADGGSDPSDLPVTSGITRDLARKVTHHALYRLAARDLPNCPRLPERTHARQ
ncbi:MAG: hypothetical protein ACLP4W_26035 [Mycobacterium sp.]|uniref:hypothetical protein n=1 Tax=Mycobacterium sp. TaxID=1785 RepID=UPI003F94EE0A